MRAEDAFLHDILGDPDNDTTRLVFADWLEDHGRESHAELIRTQCELARLPAHSRGAKVKARRAHLAAREKQLLKQPEFFPTWPAGMPRPGYESHKRSWPRARRRRGRSGRRGAGLGGQWRLTRQPPSKGAGRALASPCPDRQ